jgi:hypothetical protein
VKNLEPGPPHVSFKDFNVVKETDAFFHFGFSDPDGDIGLQASDTTGDFKLHSPYYYDFHMQIYVLDTTQNTYVPGMWVYIDPITQEKDTFGFFNYRIPYVANKATKGDSLKGEIYIEMSGYRPFTTIKKFKYKFFIYDRAHHKSNEVLTPEFTYP